jgi:fructokinase
MESALVVGEALVDVVARADGTVSEHAGGSPANVAVGLARLGRTVVLASELGDDRWGELVVGHLTDSGVVLSRGSVVPGGVTSSARAVIDPAGAATYTFDVRWQPDLAALSDSLVLHTGSMAAAVEPGASAVHTLMRERRARTTISYDVNARPALMGDGPRARERVRELAALSDVVKASDEDLAWLGSGRPWQESAEALLAVGPAAVVVTVGAQGAAVVHRDGLVSVAAPSVDVVDTVGAGDSFQAALLDALWSRDLLGADRREALVELSLDGWREIAEYAVSLAALSTTRAGAQPAYRNEVADRG